MKRNNNLALEVAHLSVHYDQKTVLWDVNFTLPKGALVAIVGPNGAGKSSLIQAILGLISPTSGHVLAFGRPIKEYSSHIAYLPQRETVDWTFPITVGELVEMGSLARIPWYKKMPTQEKELTQQALEMMGLTSLAQQPIGKLSGGQQQKCFLARSIVQQANLYLMDEPFSALDHATEIVVIDHLKNLRDLGKTLVVVHHDLNTVPSYFDHVILLNLRLISFGLTKDVFTPSNLQATYGHHYPLLEQALALSKAWQKGDL